MEKRICIGNKARSDSRMHRLRSLTCLLRSAEKHWEYLLGTFLIKEIVPFTDTAEETMRVLYLLPPSASWHLSPFFLVLSGLVVIRSPVMGDAINVELPVTAKVTENALNFADVSFVLYSPLVCLASFSNLVFIFFLLMALLINSISCCRNLS